MKMYGSVAVKLLCILNFGTRWRWLVSFTLKPSYSRGYCYVFPWVGSWLGAILSRSRRCEREKNLVPVGSRASISQSSSPWSV